MFPATRLRTMSDNERRARCFHIRPPTERQVHDFFVLCNRWARPLKTLNDCFIGRAGLVSLSFALDQIQGFKARWVGGRSPHPPPHPWVCFTHPLHKAREK